MLLLRMLNRHCLGFPLVFGDKPEYLIGFLLSLLRSGFQRVPSESFRVLERGNGFSLPGIACSVSLKLLGMLLV